MPTLSVTRNYDDGTALTEDMLDDAFDSVELFLNTTKINSANIQTGGVAETNIAASAVTESKLGTGAVTVNKIDDGAVTTAKIADANVTLAKLAAAVQALLVPTGAVSAYTGTSAPTGWLMCDGTAVSRTTYATLFGIIGTSHGQGDNSTTFNLPDYRGYFLRGVDGTADQDPDKLTRIAMNTGGNTGNNVGSIQTMATATHTHAAGSFATGTVVLNVSAGIGDLVDTFELGANDDLHQVKGTSSITGTSAATGGSETRPENAYVHFIIKT